MRTCRAPQVASLSLIVFACFLDCFRKLLFLLDFWQFFFLFCLYERFLCNVLCNFLLACVLAGELKGEGNRGSRLHNRGQCDDDGRTMYACCDCVGQHAAFIATPL